MLPNVTRMNHMKEYLCFNSQSLRDKKDKKRKINDYDKIKILKLSREMNVSVEFHIPFTEVRPCASAVD